MKYLVLALALFMGHAQAQQVSNPIAQPVSLAVAAVAGFVVLTGASLSGNLPGLCKALGGVYTTVPYPYTADQCPTGHWSNLVGIKG